MRADTQMEKIGLLLIGCVMLQGCAVVMASQQPLKKNLRLFSEGTPRSMLLGEFGVPTVTEVKDGTRHDIFKFTQGYHEVTKVGRVVVHSVADVMTLGLWEVVGTPTETIFDGRDVAYEIIYDAQDNVEQVTLLKKK
jgi:hypothetical protein